jgi:dTDP-4-dehydrorhamnose 3,5-epimerase
MNVIETDLPGVLIIEPVRHGDHRGFFSETWQRQRFADHGITADWIQDNHSRSATPGTLRGLHFQSPPHAQAKLLRCIRGSILDVAVDIRVGSPTFGRHVAVELGEANFRQLLVPRGFAHGFVTLEPDTEVLYKVDAGYAPAHDAGIAWDDPDLGIDWGFGAGEVTLSDKDRTHPRLAELGPVFTYEG